MDKIKSLLEQLENKVTPQIAKRLDSFKDLNSRLELAKKELEAKPDDEELQESLQEITEYVDDWREDLIEDLEDLLEAKKVETSKKEETPKEEKTPKVDETPKVEEKEKSSAGITAMIIGGVLLVASIGAINIFKNNR